MPCDTVKCCAVDTDGTVGVEVWHKVAVAASTARLELRLYTETLVTVGHVLRDEACTETRRAMGVLVETDLLSNAGLDDTTTGKTGSGLASGVGEGEVGTPSAGGGDTGDRWWVVCALASV